MVQCGYCARSCCSECCFKQRLDEKNRDKALICEECELLFLHFLMNKVLGWTCRISGRRSIC